MSSLNVNKVISFLISRELSYSEISIFSKLPGIYAIFFTGVNFPIFGDIVKKHQIIYIGKTESSQEKRDAKTHFSNGKTGSSTVRKSIGAILNSTENLMPIPRNDSDYKKGKFSHFKFDPKSEELITKWMINNLALSFYEYPKTKQEIEDLESKIITELVPILNISKNPKSTLKDTLKKLRKNCATVAIKNSDFKKPNPEKKDKSNPKVQSKTSGSFASGIVYIDNITKSDIKSRNIRIKVENKHLFPVEKSGKPISYSLDFKVGNIDFIANYTIGSKDGKSRSGILKLGDSIYQVTLKIMIGTNLKISKSKENIYIVERL